ncbi:N-dimethylarginine dimethylaminohydrolase [Bacillus ectoiniformans]|uniref:dimethylarginine dimethylaminohydrolase family protein n=1 Tax=Bacillus ectoiniformans TaxID=1494429 RepID=UPI001959D64B|nr:dimethylarginine dimethylaminohydrolase family protein [Bacillus ectoiniformans]MBM7649104.1 N-dimethylarginine dimethylaminohydrolase [Bacillus ectoiniformans]
MTLVPERNLKISCHSEYDKLHTVIVCEPQYMAIREVINKTQEHFLDENIDKEKAVQQHLQFKEALRKHGVDVITLPAKPELPEQVFTRDIGFTLGDTIFVAEMASNIRQGEEVVLKKWLEEKQIPYHNITDDFIEGGDVIIDRSTIYVGVSDRTNEESIKKLRTLLPEFEIFPVPFDGSYLHLDCVFNILSPDEALIFPKALNQKEIEWLSNRYQLIEVTEEEQFTMGTNVLSIGDKKVISLPMNKKVNEEMRSRGYEVIEVDISEIIKSGGSFRCCTLPILRG